MRPPAASQPRPELVTRGVPPSRPGWVENATSADHKVVGKLYVGTALTFLAVAALEFLLLRAHLFFPDSTVLEPEIFNRINTAWLATSVVFFAVPLFCGLIAFVAPLQIGARGAALPRLLQLSFWLYAFGALAFHASFLYAVPEVALSPLPPLGDEPFTPSGGVDAWIAGVGLATLGFVCWAVSIVATMTTMRAPGMAWRRAPAFGWASITTALVLLVAGAAMLAALVMLAVDRHFGGVFFDPGEDGEPMVFTHLSWIYFTGLHTAVLVAAAGAITEVLSTAAGKPLFSHTATGRSLAALGALGLLAWMQNMYSSPIPDGFLYVAMAAAVGMLVPMGVVVFNWIATLWGGAIRGGAAPALALGAAVLMIVALAGELMTAVVPVGLAYENTVAAQQDTILFYIGAAVLGGFAALHHWIPKMRGRAVGDGIALLAMALILLGALLYGTAMFLAGLEGQPVDSSRYFDGDGLQGYNIAATVGALLVFAGVLAELANLAIGWGSGRRVGHDPYRGNTLEWFALSPPPPHNFDAIPDVRSPEPLRDIREAVRARQLAFVPPAPPPAANGDRAPGDGEAAGGDAELRRGDAPVA